MQFIVQLIFPEKPVKKYYQIKKDAHFTLDVL